MNILMISTTLPYPPTAGGTEVRTYHLLAQLSQRHSVTLVTQPWHDSPPDYIAALEEIAAEVVTFSRAPEPPGGLPNKVKRFGRFLWDAVPPHVRYGQTPEMQQWIDQAVAAKKFDVITCEHSVNEIFIRPEWRQDHPDLRLVVDIHSSVYAACRDRLDTSTSDRPLRDRLSLNLFKRYEKNYCEKFSALVVTTPDDFTPIHSLAPQLPIDTIPNGVDFSRFPMRDKDPGGQKLIFFGAMDYQANIDGAIFFAKEVLPKILENYPDATLDLVGARPRPEVLALDTIPGVHVTGTVPSIAEYLHSAAVCVIPMRTGFGIKNKTLEALAAGTPVVGSDRGLEGLAVDFPGEPARALRANTIQEYVDAVDKLFANPALRNQLSTGGREYVLREFTWDRAGSRYESFIANPS
ncbi:MAG: glycosyltransferase family 4 protein [Cyanobacteria bacterium P01_F01_bin.153]